MSGELHKLIGMIKEVEPKVIQQVGSRATAASHVLRNAELEVLRGARSGIVYKKPGTSGAKMSKTTKALLSDYRRKMFRHGKLRGGQLYRGSAPGEPPAVRTGKLRSGFRPISRPLGKGYLAAIETNTHYAGYLEDGTSKMAPRPYANKIVEQAEPEIINLFGQPYDLS